MNYKYNTIGMLWTKKKIKYNKIDENQSFVRNIQKNIDEPYDFFKLTYKDSYINQIVKMMI